jgi:hypothetical protein
MGPRLPELTPRSSLGPLPRQAVAPLLRVLVDGKLLGLGDVLLVEHAGQKGGVRDVIKDYS